MGLLNHRRKIFENQEDEVDAPVNFIDGLKKYSRGEIDRYELQDMDESITLIPKNPLGSSLIIIDYEKLIIREEDKQYIINNANYSIRNMINNLEKIYILDYPIDINNCKKICTNISFQLFETYIEKLKNGDLNDCIQILYSIHDYGYSVIDILDYFFTFIKTTTLLKEDEKYEIIPFLCKYITMFHNIHEDIIELAFFTNKIYTKLHKQHN